MSKSLKLERASAKIPKAWGPIVKRGFWPLVASLAAPLLFASSASGQQRTFVSGLGNDGNPCSRSAPCRTFTQAISQTSAGGEVYVLDTSGYGPFSVNKSITVIAASGVVAGISVFAGDGIDINAGPNDTVILRGLTVNNQGSAGSGIVFNTGGTLLIENCVVNGFNGFGSAGILFQTTGDLDVKDSTVSANTLGISVSSPSLPASAAIEQVRLEDNSTGLAGLDGSKVTIRNSLATGGKIGLLASSASPGSNAVLNVENCFVFNNGQAGIEIGNTSTGNVISMVSNSIVTHNACGFRNLGGNTLFLSRGNNTVEGNSVNTNGTIGTFTAK